MANLSITPPPFKSCSKCVNRLFKLSRYRNCKFFNSFSYSLVCGWLERGCMCVCVRVPMLPVNFLLPTFKRAIEIVFLSFASFRFLFFRVFLGFFPLLPLWWRCCLSFTNAAAACLVYVLPFCVVYDNHWPIYSVSLAKVCSHSHQYQLILIWNISTLTH